MFIFIKFYKLCISKSKQNNMKTSQTKSIHLAFALTSSLCFEQGYEQEQLEQQKYYFELCRGNQVIEKSKLLSMQQLNHKDIYLYLSLPYYAIKNKMEYSIKMILETKNLTSIIFDEKIHVDQYTEQFMSENREFWTEFFQSSSFNREVAVKQRVFLRKNKFELDDLLGVDCEDEQKDRVYVMNQSSELNKERKFQIAKNKSRSLNSEIQISPLRLDTISEEGSFFASDFNKMQTLEFGQLDNQKMRSSDFGVRNDKQFEFSLRKPISFIQHQSHRPFQDQFTTAFDQRYPDLHNTDRDFNKKGFTYIKIDDKNVNAKDSQMQPKQSKMTKNTKDQSDKDDDQLSFLDKSSILSDMDISQLNIKPEQQLMFKVKYVIFFLVVILAAVLASVSTDVFTVVSKSKRKAKKHSAHRQTQSHTHRHTSKGHSNKKQTRNKKKKTSIKAKAIQQTPTIEVHA